MTPTIAVINRSTAVTDAEVQACLPDFQAQVSHDFAPVWSQDCTLAWVPKDQQPATDVWQIVLLDDSDQAGALGYHDETPAGLPLAKVFVKTTVEAGAHWTVVFTHELLETLADPWIDSTVFIDDGQGGGVLIPVEVCDPVEADQFAYTVGQTLVSDFVHPSWFQPNGVGPWDKQDHLTQSLYVLAGCYCSVAQVQCPNGWQEVFGDLAHGGTPRPGGPVATPAPPAP